MDLVDQFFFCLLERTKLYSNVLVRQIFLLIIDGKYRQVPILVSFTFATQLVFRFWFINHTTFCNGKFKFRSVQIFFFLVTRHISFTHSDVSRYGYGISRKFCGLKHCFFSHGYLYHFVVKYCRREQVGIRTFSTSGKLLSTSKLCERVKFCINVSPVINNSK